MDIVKLNNAMRSHLELLSNAEQYLYAVDSSEAAFRLMRILNRLLEHKIRSSLEISVDSDLFGYRAAVRRVGDNIKDGNKTI